jgi:hypothetical protein
MSSLAVIEQHEAAPVATGMSLYGSRDSYRMALDAAAKLAASKIVPESFKDDPGACLIAIDTASRMDVPLLMVLQNLYIVKGKPAWSGSFMIARLNSCGRFAPLDFVMDGEGDALSCYVATTRVSDGRKMRGTTITMAMVKAEGWGTKWKTMPEQMMCYRAASFFARVHAPDVILGMHTVDEVEEIPNPQWQDERPPAIQATVVDPHRDAFEAVLRDGNWTDKQRTGLRTRYANADADGRAALIASARAQLAPTEATDAGQVAHPAE